MISKTKLTAAVALMASSVTFGAEQLLEVESFSGVSIGTGMVANINCGDTNTVTLRGKQEVLDTIEVLIEANLLDISRKESAGKMFGKLFSNKDGDDSHVEMDIVTSGDISLIDVSTGAQMKVDACALNAVKVTVDGSTGSEIELNGTTMELNLDMSTGSTFNGRTGELYVEMVTLDLSTGATANLCGATQVKGDASTGAVIYVGSNVDTSQIDLSIGADTSSSRCK